MLVGIINRRLFQNTLDILKPDIAVQSAIHSFCYGLALVVRTIILNGLYGLLMFA